MSESFYIDVGLQRPLGHGGINYQRPPQCLRHLCKRIVHEDEAWCAEHLAEIKGES